MKSFAEYVHPYLERGPLVVVPPAKIKRIEEFVEAVIQAKQNEAHHQVDKHQSYKRFYTGTLGEAAVEQLLGVELIDWNVGNSNAFNQADLRSIGINAGVKTVEYGSFPVIHVYPKRPEIINVRITDSKVYVCGLATIDMLLKYQDVELIKSPSLRSRGTKTGFYGISELKPFYNLSGLKIHMGLVKKFWERAN